MDNRSCLLINLLSCLLLTTWCHGDDAAFPIEKFPAGERVSGLNSGDLNGGGIVDIVSDGLVSILFGYGDGRFQAPVQLTAGSFTSAVLL